MGADDGVQMLVLFDLGGDPGVVDRHLDTVCPLGSHRIFSPGPWVRIPCPLGVDEPFLPFGPELVHRVADEGVGVGEARVDRHCRRW